MNNQEGSILVLLSSAQEGNSVSTELVLETAGKFANRCGMPQAIRHLDQDPVPAMNSDSIRALHTPANQRNSAQRERAEELDQLIFQVQQASVIIIAAPLYNFAVPSSLKNWVDAICRAGVTFSYQADGTVKGALGDKKVLIVQTAGGIYDASSDLAMQWMQRVWGFLGVQDLSYERVQGLALPGREQAIKAAKERLSKWVVEHAEIIKAA